MEISETESLAQLDEALSYLMVAGYEATQREDALVFVWYSGHVNTVTVFANPADSEVTDSEFSLEKQLEKQKEQELFHFRINLCDPRALQKIKLAIKTIIALREDK